MIINYGVWPSVYTAAADAIQIHVEESEEEDDPSSSYTLAAPVKQGSRLSVTQTGILSNRRPIEFKNDFKPRIVSRQDGRSGVDLLVLAKREAAKRELYSRFYRGGVVNQEQEQEMKSIPDSDTIKVGAVGVTPACDRGEIDEQKEESIVLLQGVEEKRQLKEERRKRKKESKKRRAKEENGQDGAIKRQRGC